MSAKKVTFASKRPSQAQPTVNEIDDWVERQRPGLDSAEPLPPERPKPEPMKRLTIDVSMRLHTRIKSQCAMQNLHMADVIRDLLEEHFGGGTAAGEGAAS